MRRPSSLRFALAAIALLCGTQVAFAQRELKVIPDPDPELERQTFQLADGLEVNLYAADPLLAKPIHMNFDAQGRLWIASSEVYPQVKPGQTPTDKILVLESGRFAIGWGQAAAAMGVEVEVLHDGTCIALMRSFIAEKPGLWDEDIGKPSGLNARPGAG